MFESSRLTHIELTVCYFNMGNAGYKVSLRDVTYVFPLLRGAAYQRRLQPSHGVAGKICYASSIVLLNSAEYLTRKFLPASGLAS